VHSQVPFDADKMLVFIHVPKTGGTSIEHMFGLREPSKFFSKTPIPTLTPPNKTPQHFTYRELQNNLPPDFLRAAYKFAFVRNPWDRFLSEYCYRRDHYKGTPVLRSGRYHYNDTDLESLGNFTRIFERPPEKLREATGGFDGHIDTQLSYLVDDDGKIATDFVGRFEEFETHVRFIAQRFNLPITAMSHLERSSRQSDYRIYYSDYSRAAVADFYKCDIETFGYAF
jgi:hypothetical protein